MTSDDRLSNVPVPRGSDDGYAEGTSAAGDRILARIEELKYKAGRVLTANVVGPHGQNLTVSQARARADELDTKVEMEELRGSLRHRRVHRWTRVLTFTTVAVIDLPIMLWLASSVFNVDWTDPIGLPLLISAVTSVLATGGAATALHHLGHNQRQHKNDRRQLVWSELSTGAKLSLASVGLLVSLMGIVMFVRMETEGVLSGLNSLATLMAVLVAVVLVVSALLVFWTAFRDGSLEQDDLCHYSERIRPHLELKREYEDKAQELTYQYEMLRRRGQREFETRID